MGCPETSVRNYHNTMRNSPEERVPHVYVCLVLLIYNYEIFLIYFLYLN
jgi:energy-converting hydrogenase Eha subunit E